MNGAEKERPFRLRAVLIGLLAIELLFWGGYAVFHFGIVERMEGFRYGTPQALNALYFLPLLPLGILTYMAWKAKAFARFGEWPLIRKGVRGHNPKQDFVQNGSFRLGIGLLIFALAQPQLGTKKEEAEAKGFDLMVCLDLSSSMNAEDIRPSRLQKARRALEKLLDRLHGDRVGMVVFAGDAYVQLPITSDHSAARIFLSNLSTEIVPTQGTSLGEAIDLARNSFQEDSETRKAIIVISDGENHSDDPVAAAERAAEEEVVVHTVGMGTPEGGPIPIYKNDRQVGYKKDRNGETVVSKLDEEILTNTAEAGNGSFVRANNTRVGLNALMQELEELQKERFDTTVYRDHADRYQLFLYPGALFLILATVLGSWPGTAIFGRTKEMER